MPSMAASWVAERIGGGGGAATTAGGDCATTTGATGVSGTLFSLKLARSLAFSNSRVSTRTDVRRPSKGPRTSISNLVVTSAEMTSDTLFDVVALSSVSGGPATASGCGGGTGARVGSTFSTLAGVGGVTAARAALALAAAILASRARSSTSTSFWGGALTKDVASPSRAACLAALALAFFPVLGGSKG